MKPIFLAAVALLFIGFGCSSNSTPTNPVIENSVITPAVETTTEPLSYSIVGVSTSVSKSSEPFDYTAADLKIYAEECGSEHEVGYFDDLVAKFSGTTKSIYNFKYTGESQESNVYTVTLLPNKPGYTSLEQFNKDFDLCLAGGQMYPTMLDNDWLLFVSSCGSGYSDDSGRPVGCEEVRKVVEPTLELGVEEKAWRLAFDLPAGWVMAAYGSPRTQNQIAPNLEVKKDANNIYLQNTTKFPLFGGVQPDDYSVEKYQNKNVVQIKVSTLDKDEVVPPLDSVKNEDLGKGFYKVTTCDLVVTPECGIYGQSPFEYYFVATSGNKYRFSFLSQDIPESVIQAVVLSAKE